MINESEPRPVDPQRRQRRGRPSKPETLTITRLKVLCALHRRGLDGAGAELIDVLDTRKDELAAMLSLEPTDFPAMGASERIPILVSTIEARLAEIRSNVVGDRLAEAQRIALQLSEAAVHDSFGVELDQTLLAKLVSAVGFELLVFKLRGEQLGVGRMFVAALLREVGSVRLTSLCARAAPS